MRQARKHVKRTALNKMKYKKIYTNSQAKKTPKTGEMEVLVTYKDDGTINKTQTYTYAYINKK